MIEMTGVVLRFDGVPDSSGDVFSEDTGIELPSRDVPVTLEFHDRPEFWLGFAKLYFRPGALHYRMQLDDTRLPKYALETLTPCAGGFVVAKEGNVIKHCKITSIGLSIYGNADFRIKPLKDQK